MTQYRKKPVVIDAVQFHDWMEPYGDEWPQGVHADKLEGRWSLPYIRTLEGIMQVRDCDWIVKGVQGEFYPVKPDIFAATYDEVSV